jgi:hypothetical protein
VASLNIKQIVKEKVDSFDLMRLERLLLSIMEEQFNYISLFSAILVFWIGCLNVLFLPSFEGGSAVNDQLFFKVTLYNTQPKILRSSIKPGFPSERKWASTKSFVTPAYRESRRMIAEFPIEALFLNKLDWKMDYSRALKRSGTCMV